MQNQGHEQQSIQFGVTKNKALSNGFSEIVNPDE
jgi:hypothetical protein